VSDPRCKHWLCGAMWGAVGCPPAHAPTRQLGRCWHQRAHVHMPYLKALLRPLRPLACCRKLSLARPSPADFRYLRSTLDREMRTLGGPGVRPTGGDGRSLEVLLPPEQAE